MSERFNNAELRAIYERRRTGSYGEPLETVWRKTSWLWIFSRHNLDLGLVAAIYVAVLLAAIGGLVASGLMQSQNGLGPGLQILYGTAIFGGFTELLRRTYDRAVKRLATINLFASEIISIMRVFAAGNIIGEFVRLYDQLGRATLPVDTDGAKSAGEGQRPSGLADTARSENYFSIFEKNSTDLALLHPAVVNDIAAFYTFLKGSRDATGAMQLWKEEGYSTSSKMEDVKATIYLCFLTALHGKLALDQLIMSPVNRAIVDEIFAGAQLQCFSFLDLVLQADDYRRIRIEQRRSSANAIRQTYGYAF